MKICRLRLVIPVPRGGRRSRGFDFGGEGMGEEAGVAFFCGIGTSVAAKAAEDGHVQSVIEIEGCKCAARRPYF